MTADDVVWSINRVVNPATQSPGQGFFGMIEGFDDAAAGKVISIPTAKWKAAIFVAQHGPRAFLRWFSGKLSSSRHKQ